MATLRLTSRFGRVERGLKRPATEIENPPDRSDFWPEQPSGLIGRNELPVKASMQNNSV